MTQSIYTTYKEMMPIVVGNPATPYTSGSAAYGSNYNGLSQALNSAVADCVSGKTSVSSWSSTVAQLRSQFQVSQIEAQLATQYAAVNG